MVDTAFELAEYPNSGSHEPRVLSEGDADFSGRVVGRLSFRSIRGVTIPDPVCVPNETMNMAIFRSGVSLQTWSVINYLVMTNVPSEQTVDISRK